MTKMKSRAIEFVKNRTTSNSKQFEWHKCCYIFKQLHEQANNSRTHLSIVRLTKPSSELKPRIRHLKDNIHIIRNDE